MFRFTLCVVLVAGLCVPAAAQAITYPLLDSQQGGLERLGQLRPKRSEEINGSLWGVSCHWLTDPHELTTGQRLEQVANLGAKWGFLVPDWDHIETAQGQYDFNSSAHRLDDAVYGMVERNIQPIIQIYGGNHLYMPVAMDPNNRQTANAATLLDNSQVRQAWHNYLETMVLRYKDQVKVWEIWNEPNYAGFWAGTTATVSQYGRMVQDVAGIIKGIDPSATILAGSTANVPLTYFQGLLASAGANSFDFCSVHPYGAVPEDAGAGIRALQTLLASNGKSSVLWQTECGFPSSGDTAGWGYGGPWDETKHAKWVLRRFLSDAAMGMKNSTYFTLDDYPSKLDGGPDAGQMGINYKGLYRSGSWEPKSAADAYCNLASLIDDRLEPEPVQTTFQIVESGSFTGIQADMIRTYTLVDKETGSALVAYWLPTPMETDVQAAKINLSLAADIVPDRPVLVDLLDGSVYKLETTEPINGIVTFLNIPLTDSPLVLCDLTLADLLVVPEPSVLVLAATAVLWLPLLLLRRKRRQGRMALMYC